MLKQIKDDLDGSHGGLIDKSKLNRPGGGGGDRRRKRERSRERKRRPVKKVFCRARVKEHKDRRLYSANVKFERMYLIRSIYVVLYFCFLGMCRTLCAGLRTLNQPTFSTDRSETTETT